MNILIWAIISIAIGYKLYKILGDTSYSNDIKSDQDNMKIRRVQSVIDEDNFSMQSMQAFHISQLTQENLDKMSSIIGNHHSKDFIQNAGNAFEYITKLFAERNLAFLQKLVVGDALSSFDQRIASLNEAMLEEVIAIVSIKNIELIEVVSEENVISCTVLFETEQIKYTKKKNSDELIDGSKTRILQVKEEWSFIANQKDVSWMLTQIKAKK